MMSDGSNTAQGGQTDDSVPLLQHKSIWSEADCQAFCQEMNKLDEDDMAAMTTLHETMLKRKLSNLQAVRNIVYYCKFTLPLTPNFPLAHTLAEFAAIEEEVKDFRDHMGYVTRQAQDMLNEFAARPSCNNCSLHKLEANLSHSKALRDFLQQSDSTGAVDPALLFANVCDLHKGQVLEVLNNDIAHMEDRIANRYTAERGYKCTVKYHGLMSPVLTEIETKIVEHRARLALYI